ncbi:MAG: aminoacyl-tRNA hydrolase [Gemmatimonadetes bacterium]|nr:aminoacyl-tRNA hydrolase [Gemmatimonadota bacterium]
MKFICGLGNPGPEYEATRHNVGWWVVDRLRQAWGLGRYRREGAAQVADGRVGEHSVRLIKPLTYVNRSGAALAPLLRLDDFDAGRDLLVVVDDVALDVGRVRVRARGSAGGHNGLKSVEAVLGTREYARLRIGVGAKPRGVDLADWVLSPMPADEEVRVLEVLPALVDVISAWVEGGVGAALAHVQKL